MTLKQQAHGKRRGKQYALISYSFLLPRVGYLLCGGRYYEIRYMYETTLSCGEKFVYTK